MLYSCYVFVVVGGGGAAASDVAAATNNIPTRIIVPHSNNSPIL